MEINSSQAIWEKIYKGVLVIAEAGKNFIQTEEEQSADVYLDNAKKLAREAKEAGADAVKFQTHNIEDEQLNIKITSPHFTGSDRYRWVKRNTLSTPIDGFWQPLKEYCEKLGIIFFSTPMSRGAAQKLEEINVPLWKVGSGDILDFVLLDFIGRTKKPVILSSGMSTLEEIDLAINFLRKRNSQIALLHCVSKYPCPVEDLNLGTIEFFQKRYDMPIGFSDHSLGTGSALEAAALGAKIIEKHFSLSRNFWGSDHKVSILPDELKEMVGAIREFEKNPKKREGYLNKDIIKTCFGRPSKILQEGEAVFRPIFRKALVAGCDISRDTILKPEMIFAMRPQSHINGLPSEKYEEVLGKRVKHSLKKYDPINYEVLSL